MSLRKIHSLEMAFIPPAQVQGGILCYKMLTRLSCSMEERASDLPGTLDPGCPGSHQRLTSDLRCDWSHVVYGTSRQHPPPKALIPAIYFYRRRPGRTRLFIQTPVVIPSSAMHRLARGMAEGSWQICNVRFLEGQGKSGVKLRL